MFRTTTVLSSATRNSAESSEQSVLTQRSPACPARERARESFRLLSKKKDHKSLIKLWKNVCYHKKYDIRNL